MGEELSVFAKNRKTKKTIRIIFLSVLIFALLGIAAYFALTRYFVVNEIAIQASTIYSEEEVRGSFVLEKKTPLILVSKKDVCRSIEESFPYLVDVKVDYDLPGKVNITFREEFGKISLQLGEELFCIDDHLTVLAKETPDSKIPRIRLLTSDVSRCIVGEKLRFFEEEGANTVLAVYNALIKEEMSENVASINVEDKFNIKVRYLDRFDLLLGDESDLGLKLRMVKEVVRDVGEGESGIIDIVDPNTAYVKLTEVTS